MAKGSSSLLPLLGLGFFLLLALFVKEGQGLKCYLGSKKVDKYGPLDCEELGDPDDEKAPFHQSCKGRPIADRDRCVSSRTYGVEWVYRSCACSKGLSDGGAKGCSLIEDDLIRLCICDEDSCNNEFVDKPPRRGLSCLIGDDSNGQFKLDCQELKVEDGIIHNSCDGRLTTDRDRCVAYRKYGENDVTRTCGCSQGLSGGNGCSLVENDRTRICTCDTNDCNDMPVQKPPTPKEGGGSTAATIHAFYQATIVIVIPALTLALY